MPEAVIVSAARSPIGRAFKGSLMDLPEIADHPEDSPELAAARRRHPSHPDFVPVQTPVVTDHERTVSRLEELADLATELTDVRPGPLGTLDVYVFADGTTLCMTPGHRETAERLADALRAGRQPVLLGGSGVSGAYALTFSCGEDNVYILADRVIASF
ncbi:Secreted protein OS=Streptomyces microflavus OX=1919 GN=G3I39_13930 PE=4 SV=1 [Streptomyces microflavus]